MKKIKKRLMGKDDIASPSWTGYLDSDDYVVSNYDARYRSGGCEDLTRHLKRGSIVRAKVTGSNDSFIFLSCAGVKAWGDWTGNKNLL